MRKKLFCALCAAMLCAVLCGCGNQNQRHDDMVIGTPVVPETSPVVSSMPTLDPQDGYVDDKDGIIEEAETGRDEKTGGKTNDGKNTVSPSPEVTSKP